MAEDDPRKEAAKNLRDDVLWQTHMLALGFLVDNLLAAHFAQQKDPKAAAGEWLRLCEAIADRFTFDGVDPAVSDVATQELRDTLIRHVHRARALASGEPFDPNSYRGRTPGS